MTELTTPTVDLGALKAKQQATWASGDYAVVGTTLQIVGERLCETIDLRAGSKVLDVAAGNGNATLAAARRFCDVTSTDYVPALLERGRGRAAAEHQAIDFRVEDAEALSFADASFDVVLSTFGVMFTADHGKAAAEMLRVCKPGGTIAMANWTPEGFIGRVFKTIGRHLPPPPGARSPALWGTRDAIEAMFGHGARSIELVPQTFAFRYRSPEHFVEVFRTWYGPTHKAFQALGDKGAALEADMLALLDELNTARDGTLVVPSAYVEVVIRKA
jgi:ubiquinone/menaquinone biosynthesis C-methylase UbiE